MNVYIDHSDYALFVIIKFGFEDEDNPEYHSQLQRMAQEDASVQKKRKKMYQVEDEETPFIPKEVLTYASELIKDANLEILNSVMITYFEGKDLSKLKLGDIDRNKK